MRLFKHTLQRSFSNLSKLVTVPTFYCLVVLLGLLYSNQSYAQSPCPEAFFNNPFVPDSDGRAPSFLQPTMNSNSEEAADPDTVSYPDAFPTKKWVFNTVFKIIRDDNGIRATGDVGENQVMDRIRDLNLAFNQFNIFFKYGGLEFIDMTALTGDQNFSDLSDNFIEPYWTQDCFCIFVLDGDILTTDLDGTVTNTPGLGYLLGGISFFNTLAINSTRIVNHEVGHNFYLRHDFANYGDPFGCEHVIRNTQDSSYNADDHGDWIHDTPATKIWDISEYDQVTGFYEGGDIDCNNSLSSGDPDRFYKTGNARINNFMHWHPGDDLSDGYYFSPGQGKRMRWVIATDIIQNYGIYSPLRVEVEALYQPFDVYETGGDAIVSVTDNNDGTANVCRNRVRNDRFQKGFDATYYNMDDTPITSSTPDQLQVILGRTSDYKVKIYQVDPNITEIVSVICTRGVVCTDEVYVGGVLISTAILGSMNITVQQLTEIQLNDPELYNNLMENYYHILKKQTTSGAESKVVIYKN